MTDAFKAAFGGPPGLKESAMIPYWFRQSEFSNKAGTCQCCQKTMARCRCESKNNYSTNTWSCQTHRRQGEGEFAIWHKPTSREVGQRWSRFQREQGMGSKRYESTRETVDLLLGEGKELLPPTTWNASSAPKAKNTLTHQDFHNAGYSHDDFMKYAQRSYTPEHHARVEYHLKQRTATRKVLKSGKLESFDDFPQGLLEDLPTLRVGQKVQLAAGPYSGKRGTLVSNAWAPRGQGQPTDWANHHVVRLDKDSKDHWRAMGRDNIVVVHRQHVRPVGR